MSISNDRPQSPSSKVWPAISIVLLLGWVALAVGGWQFHRTEIRRLERQHAVEMNVASMRVLEIGSRSDYHQLSPRTLAPFLPYARRQEQPDGTVRHYWQESWPGGGCYGWIAMTDNEVSDGFVECQEM